MAPLSYRTLTSWKNRLPPPGVTGGSRSRRRSEARFGRRSEEADAITQLPFTLSLGECPDDVGKGAEVDASSGLRSLDGKRDGEVAFCRCRAGRGSGSPRCDR
jgi:hypothetical protein